MRELFYYKMLQKLFTKKRQVFLLQNATVITMDQHVITKCDVYYKIHRRNTQLRINQIPFCEGGKSYWIAVW